MSFFLQCMFTHFNNSNSMNIQFICSFYANVHLDLLQFYSNKNFCKEILGDWVVILSKHYNYPESFFFNPNALF